MMLSEIQSAPQEFDVIVATDVTLPLLSQYKLLAELDLTKIPNRKFIKKEFRNIPSDPQGKYGLINTWGTTGFVINTNFVPADTDSWAVLWDKKYKGKIALLDECREAMTAVLKYSHFSLNTTNHQELEIAKENVLLLKDNQVQFADTLGNLEKVKSGELWIAQVYGGDVATYAKGRKDIKYVYPKEGFTIIVDNLVISADSAHKEEAYQLINFFLEPKNAALI
ncbi:MAG: spermidine/putrescine ABC transporter substrate-binding protein, partial [Candidatus Omnitrophica bacterium]|nr:spermidine/putrescine ABC transporter substrate-binding protein [Candidatus Omnitrophota bacterium]